jgi:hypothetical protein
MPCILDQIFLYYTNKCTTSYTHKGSDNSQHYCRNDRETTELFPRITKMEIKFYVEIWCYRNGDQRICCLMGCDAV